MMGEVHRYFIHLAYDGTGYHGWQIQPNGLSVEGELERCLSTILRTEIDVVGAGRTDAGVHARHMVAHFDFDEVDCQQLSYKLNRILPPDITVYGIEEVDKELHARFSATSRTYHYYVSTRRTPFNRQYSWNTHFELDFQLMNEAAAILLEYKDFACFCKSHTDVKTTLCDVMEAKWVKVDSRNPSQREECLLDEKGGGSIDMQSEEWYFRIKANRFLRNMVRAVVGTLVEVGRHRMTLEEFRQVIEGGLRTKAGESMPGNALFLEKIEY